MTINDFKLADFKCAILDLDGTLLNSTGVWEQIDIEFLGKRGIEVPKDFMEAIKTHNFMSGAVYAVERFGLDEKPEDIVKEWYDMAIQEYTYNICLKPYAKEYLEMLKKKGIKLVVATSSDRVLYEPCLKRNGIYELFDDFTQTDEVERGKGFPDVYELAAKKAGVSKEACVVFEDIVRAVEGARSGDFFTVAIADNGSLKDEKRIREVCDVYVENYKDLLED
ncbi:MAG: HAD family phosphatase [Lachnospira sp.]|nr:HAD family phosphatase [Lachnospira sp.]